MAKLNDKGNIMLVKYDNKVNLLGFKNIDKTEASLFFSIISRFKERGDEVLKFTFAELTEHIQKNETNTKIADIIESGIEKIIKTALKWEITPTKTAYFTIFNKFFIDKENYTIEANINDLFLDILNNFEKGNFTAFELEEFCKLSSKYTQTLYRLLRQFKKTGVYTAKWNDFLNLMDIPKSYTTGMIEKRILKPAIEELTKKQNKLTQKPIFEKLSYEKIKGTGRGQPIQQIRFYFMPEVKSERERKKKELSLEMIADYKRIEHYKREQIKKDRELKPEKIKRIYDDKEITENVFYQINTHLKPLYENRYLEFINKFGKRDTLKIKNIYNTEDGKIVALLLNMDDNKSFSHTYKSPQHFENVFKRYGRN